MTPRYILRVVSLIVATFGAVVLVETGRLALALGAVAGIDSSAGSSSASAFWYQLSFMRLFGVALIGLAALSVWGASQLTTIQQRSLGRLLGAVFAVLALMAVGQQVAIWGAVAGWGVAGVLGLVAAMYGLSTLGRLSRPAA
jgi:membrane-anchored protein YejM (alkaline phosphatase superfamily)